jgi:hypothetical protein
MQPTSIPNPGTPEPADRPLIILRDEAADLMAAPLTAAVAETARRLTALINLYRPTFRKEWI